MVGSVGPLKNVEHRWVQSFLRCNVNKFGQYSPYGDGSDFLTSQIRKIKLDPNGKEIDPDRPYFQNALVTHLGFKTRPLGILFRNLDKKEFIRHDFRVGRSYSFYVSDKFEQNKEKFIFGKTPLVLLEGALDVEACAYLTRYPFVMGYLTAYVTTILAGYISSFTNKVIIVPDSDPGDDIKKCTESSIRAFEQYGVVPYIVNTISKDFGEVLDNNNLRDVNTLVAAIKYQISL